MNPNITWNIVQANPEKPWSYEFLSKNPNITWDIVQANPNKDWNFKFLSANINITWDIVESNPDKPWNYDVLLQNPNITWNYVLLNADKFLSDSSSHFISQNPNITWKIIRDHPEIFYNFSLLSENEYSKNKTVHKRLISQKYFKIWLYKSRRNKQQREYVKLNFKQVLHQLEMKNKDNLKNKNSNENISNIN